MGRTIRFRGTGAMPCASELAALRLRLSSVDLDALREQAAAGQILMELPEDDSRVAEIAREIQRGELPLCAFSVEGDREDRLDPASLI